MDSPATILGLSDNPALSNIQPLLDNTGLGAGDNVDLRSTNVSCTDVAALQAKGSHGDFRLLVKGLRRSAQVGFVSVIVASVIFALGLPLVLV